MKDAIYSKELELEATQKKLKERQKILNQRLSSIYINGDIQPLELLLNSKSFQEFLSRLELLIAIGQNDIRILNQITEIKEEIEEARARLEIDRKDQQNLLDQLNQKQKEININLQKQQQFMDNLQEELDQLESQKSSKIEEKKRMEEEKRKAMAENNSNENGGSSKSINGFVFPVAGPHGYINSWGYPRSGGRTHEGIDIFALKGTKLLACSKGIASGVEPFDDDIGGISLWIIGDDGYHYYYAHLDSIAQGVNNGVRLKAGQLVGYVGNSGNAIATPPHLHFGVYPNGGSAINPYSILKAADK